MFRRNPNDNDVEDVVRFIGNLWFSCVVGWFVIVIVIGGAGALQDTFRYGLTMEEFKTLLGIAFWIVVGIAIVCRRRIVRWWQT